VFPVAFVVRLFVFDFAISTDSEDNPPDSVVFPVAFVVRLFVFDFAISTDSEDNPPDSVVFPVELPVIFSAIAIGVADINIMIDGKIQAKDLIRFLINCSIKIILLPGDFKILDVATFNLCI
jgi:uncharacterized membrane protein